MSAYQTIRGILADVAEDPETLTIQILEALRPLPEEVAQAGVEPDQWERASEAMIAVGSVAASSRQAKEADIRRLMWPGMKNRLEQSGCRVTTYNGNTWCVVGAGLSIDIELGTGDIQYSDGEGGEQLAEFEHIVEDIVRSVRSREAAQADMARRKARRKTHQWDNKKKVWLPKNGVDQPVLGGN